MLRYRRLEVESKAVVDYQHRVVNTAAGSLQLVLVNTADLRVLHTQVVERLALTGVVENHHEFWQAHPERDPLVVPERLSQGMAAVVPAQVDGAAPSLYQLCFRPIEDRTCTEKIGPCEP